jgi:hypothetical protein
MSVFITGGGYAPEIATDEHTLFLLHGEEIADSSIYGRTITNNGVMVSDERAKFGEKSLYIAAGTYASAEIPVSGDCTVDCWMCIKSYASAFPTPFNWAFTGDRGIYAHFLPYVSYPSSGPGYIATEPCGLDKWYHVAMVRNGNLILYFQDGKLLGTLGATTTENLSFVLGYLIDAQSATWFDGYIDELRVSDIARWTSDFKPPINPYKGAIT